MDGVAGAVLSVGLPAHSRSFSPPPRAPRPACTHCSLPSLCPQSVSCPGPSPLDSVAPKGKKNKSSALGASKPKAGEETREGRAVQAERTASAKTLRLETRQHEENSRKVREVMGSKPGRNWFMLGVRWEPLEG